jgi:hypothetical protein
MSEYDRIVRDLEMGHKFDCLCKFLVCLGFAALVVVGGWWLIFGFKGK